MRPLIAIDGEEVGCLVTLKRRCEGTGIVTFAGPFNLDHLSSKIAQQHSAVRPRKNSREIKYPNAFERSHGPLLRLVLRPTRRS